MYLYVKGMMITRAAREEGIIYMLMLARDGLQSKKAASFCNVKIFSVLKFRNI
jgi:hypothetical protein